MNSSAVSSSPSPALPALSPAEEQLLLQLARRSIEHGLHHHRALTVESGQYPLHLLEPWAAFVTLRHGPELRGCIGTLEAPPSLVANIAKYAFCAAFQDSRFDALTWAELPELNLQISILSRLEPLRFTSEADLLRQIQPGTDGLLLASGNHRGTFLPSVWEMLPEREEFWRHLKTKAGLAADYWSNDIKIQRYTTYCFGADVKSLS